jgi:hypothetical protein
MMTDINKLQNERQLMRQAETKIRDALANESPGVATSDILQDYTNLTTEAEKVAFVSVLATRLAIKHVISSANT